jgi:hypothetical protein
LAISKIDGKSLASIEIFSDEVTKEIEAGMEKKNLIQNFKKELKTYYDCKMRSN